MKNLYIRHIELDNGLDSDSSNNLDNYLKNDNRNNDKRSQEEIYQAIVTRIKNTATNELSDQEANLAARNLISFCQKILDYKIKQMNKKIS